jgi:glycerol-3-phosphate dehydrogenase (NAD(P)+)
MRKIGIVGAGAWGTALAITAQRAHHQVTVWSREPAVVMAIDGQHENTLFLPGIELPSGIRVTNDLHAMLQQEILFLVVPAQYVRATCERLSSVGLDTAMPLIICSKGIERRSAKLMSEVVKEVLPNPMAVLTGPTFAAEVAKGFPASATLACKDPKLGKWLAQAVTHPRFRIYHSSDVVSSQICGAVKNVIAIACGIIEGMGLGESARAALIFSGLAEIRQLCIAKGGNRETVMEPCGVGDLMLTCSSRTSRNMSLGYALGQGKTLEQIMEKRRSVAEGVTCADAVKTLAGQLGIRLPICEVVDRIVRGNADVEEMVATLVGE